MGAHTDGRERKTEEGWVAPTLVNFQSLRQLFPIINNNSQIKMEREIPFPFTGEKQWDLKANTNVTKKKIHIRARRLIRKAEKSGPETSPRLGTSRAVERQRDSNRASTGQAPRWENFFLSHPTIFNYSKINREKGKYNTKFSPPPLFRMLKGKKLNMYLKYDRLVVRPHYSGH